MPNTIHLLAYLDPGAGAIVIQVVIAAILSTGVYFRRAILSPVKTLFGRGGVDESDDDATSPDESEPGTSS